MDKIRIYMEKQIKEIEIYKWCLGVELNYDPLLDFTINEIAERWIKEHAENFRKNYGN